MNLRLRAVSAAEYAREVLPLTAELWAHGRDFETYVRQTAEVAASPYGRASYSTQALCGDDTRILASFKRYERAARTGSAPLLAMGIGAVFTPPEQRGCGYASAMLALALDDARARGCDFAYLFSDIHPQFYKEVGFHELPSRTISLRADALSGERIAAEPLRERDWSLARACFDAMEQPRIFALLRTPTLWSWIRMRLRHSAESPDGQPVRLAVRRTKSIAAYVIGRREPKHDAFVLDEAAFAGDEHAALIVPLLRSAAGDLRRIAGWLPPAPVRKLLPRGSVRRRSDAVLMIAPLSAGGAAFLRAAQSSGASDAMWALDHI